MELETALVSSAQGPRLDPLQQLTHPALSLCGPGARAVCALRGQHQGPGQVRGPRGPLQQAKGSVKARESVLLNRKGRLPSLPQPTAAYGGGGVSEKGSEEVLAKEGWQPR